MMLWSPAFATGHPAIDRQHQTLFQRVHDLAEAVYQHRGEQEMRRALSAASVYVEIHFSMEEDLMRGAGYPALAGHRTSHDHLRARVEAMVDDFKEGRLKAEALLSFLENWLTAHVLREDRALAAYLQARPGDEATA
jgi:hemerythrin